MLRTTEFPGDAMTKRFSAFSALTVALALAITGAIIGAITGAIIGAITLAPTLARAQTAVEESGVQFPSSVPVDAHLLSLNGTGTRTATIFGIRVYAAALYTKSTTQNAKQLFDSQGPHQIVMHFLRGVSSEKLQDAWSKGLEKNNENAAQFAGSLKALNDVMRDVEDGDRLSVTFLPGMGVRVFFNQDEGRLIEDKAFAVALLRVWLGSSPPNPALKKGLLGK